MVPMNEKKKKQARKSTGFLQWWEGLTLYPGSEEGGGAGEKENFTM